MKPKVYIYISTYKYTYIYILCIIYILYVYLCVCVCMCVYVICRPIAIVSTDIFLQKLLYTFLLQKPNSPPSFVSFNGFNSPFGFFHQPNDARKRANYWPRDTCAISYGATFLPNVPSYPPPILGKENCPKIADRRAIAAMGKPSSFFFTLIHERKKRKEWTSEIFQFFRSKIGRKRIQKRSRMYPARKCDRSAEL